MNTQELQSQLEDFKEDVILAIEEKVVLKVKNEVKNEIIASLAKQIEHGNNKVVAEVRSVGEKTVAEVRSVGEKTVAEVRSVGEKTVAEVRTVGEKLSHKLDLLQESLETGNLQSHNILSNIASTLKKMNESLVKIEAKI